MLLSCVAQVGRPMEGTPINATVVDVGRRVHHVATYISGGADHVGLTYKWSAADVLLPWEPVSSGVGRCRVRLLGGGLLAWLVFSFAGFDV